MHTPTPWAAKFGLTSWEIVANHSQPKIATVTARNNEDEADANAALIVKACNMHEELLAVVRSLIPLAVHTSPLDVSVAIARNLLAKAANE